jgi:hypothetical protein
VGNEGLESQMNMNTLLKGMTILLRYLGKSGGEVLAGQDVIYLEGPLPSVLTLDDAKSLEWDGWLWDEKRKYWRLDL